MNTKKGRKLGKGSLEVLSKLSQSSALAINDFLDSGLDYDKRIYAGMAKRLYGLSSAGYIRKGKAKNKRNQSFYHLTPKGKLEFLKYFHLEKFRSKKWDGYLRIVIFDIPEDLRKKRNMVRIKLKQLGFLPLQQSVYITPYPVKSDLEYYLEENKLSGYFHFLTVKEIDGAEEIRKRFGLK